MRTFSSAIIILSIILVPNVFSASDNYKYAKELQKYINQHFRQYTPIKTIDYESYVLDFINPNSQIIGDFDGNGYEDICVVLKKHPKGIYVISFHKQEHSFNHFVLNKRDWTSTVRENLELEESGHVRISSPDSALETILIKNPAIILEFIETDSETLYIWEKDQFETYDRGL